MIFNNPSIALPSERQVVAPEEAEEAGSESEEEAEGAEEQPKTYQPPVHLLLHV